MSNNGNTTHHRVGVTGRPEPAGPVVVHEDAIHLVDFEERDPETVAFVGSAEDPVEAAHQCLRVGAQAVRAAHVSLDSDIVRGRFDAMSEHFDTQVGAAVNQIAEATRSIVDKETGTLPTVLDAHQQKLEDLLGTTFDPESKKSVLALFEQVMADSHQTQVTAVKKLISAEGEDSPLKKMKDDIVDEFSRRLGEIRGDVQGLSEKIAVKAAVDPVVAITTAKGFAFEEVVHDQVGRIATAHGDTTEEVGNVLGSNGTKKGDEVVTVNREDTYGEDGRFVLEAKARPLNMRKIHEELDAALGNRDAQAAVAVFSRQEEAPTPVPFSYSDNKAIAVLDEDGDDAALRLAYMWARWVVRRQFASTEGGDLDTARIMDLIEEVARALKRSTTIKRSHTTAKKSIDQAGREVTALVNEVREALEALGTELGAGGEDE